VELNNVRSFYKESQKSPFKFFPWRSGTMHLRFLPDGPAARPSPLASLHAHRRVLGVIGVVSCPHAPDVAAAHAEFEARCRAFPAALTRRCFAFEPRDDQAAADARGLADLIIFPPSSAEEEGGLEPRDDQAAAAAAAAAALFIDPHGHLANHAEVVMHDFAACLLGGLESWMLSAAPGMAELTTLVDSPEFTGGAPAPYAAEEEAARTKRRYARLQKAMGDHSLLAGSPLDAVDHYNTAVELGRASLDWTFAAAALQGYAAAKILHAAAEHDAFAADAGSVFTNEAQWRTPRGSGDGGGGGAPAGTEAALAVEGPIPTAASPTAAAAAAEAEAAELPPQASSPAAALPAHRRAGSAGSAGSGRSSSSGGGGGRGSAFGGAQFWGALRRAEGLEAEACALMEEAKAAIRRRGGLPLLVEAELTWARFLAGMHVSRPRDCCCCCRCLSRFFFCRGVLGVVPRGCPCAEHAGIAAATRLGPRSRRQCSRQAIECPVDHALS
jgi:hypothetical protein